MCGWINNLFGKKADLWRAFSAFADSFPGHVKRITKGGGISFHAETWENGKLAWWEAFPKSGGYNEIVYNGLWLDRENDLICADCTIPHDHKGAVWTPPFPRAPRHYKLSTSETIQTPVIRVKDEQLDLSCKIISTTYYDAFTKLNPPEMVDVGGNIGERWSLTLSVFGGAERFVLDLGPEAGKFDPLYGVIGHHAGSDWSNMRWLGKVEVGSFDKSVRYTGKPQ